MADGGDECDLDTLSALLEDDSDSDDSTPAGARENMPADNSNANAAAEEEIDMEALSSMLDQDSDMEDTEDKDTTNACADQEEITAEDIAAFLNESSDSEEGGDEEEKEKCNGQSGQDTDVKEDNNTAAAEDGVESSDGHHDVGSGANSTQQDPEHMRILQEEMAMMQRRMMEIQNMLGSCSTSTPTPTLTPAPAAVTHRATPRPTVKQRVKQVAAAKSLSSTSSSSVSSTSSCIPLTQTHTHIPAAASATQADNATPRPSARKHTRPIGVHKSLSSTSSSSDSSSYFSSSKSSSTKHIRTCSEDPAPQRPEERLSLGSSNSSVLQKHKKTLSGSLIKMDKSLVSSVSSSEKHTTLSSSVHDVKKHKPVRESTPGSCKSKGQTSSRSGKELSNGVLPSSKTPASSDLDSQPPIPSRKTDTAAKFSAKISGSAKKEHTPADRAPLVAKDDKASVGAKKRASSSFLSDLAETEGSREGQSLKTKLFGEDSDSDWEDMDGDKQYLSSSGQDIKRLLQQGERQRVAHTPSSYTPSTSTTSTVSASSWKSKSGLSSSNQSTSKASSSESSSGSSVGGVRGEPDTKDYITDKFSGLRVINPKISNAMLASKMEGRRLVQASTIHLKLKCPELQGDWVTIGVIVSKSESRKSQTGKTYSILKLSDLSSDTMVSFFLFGQVYKQLWKMDVGLVIGILNPSIMDSMDKGGNDVAFTVNNAQQVMEIGRSKDFGWCIAKTKRGAACTNVVNKKLGDFCTYHVQTAYRKQSAKRSELHGSCPGTTPKNSLKSKILANNTFFYGGESFSNSKGVGGKGKKDKVTLGKLQAVVSRKDQRKVNTLAVQNLMPDQASRVQSSLASQHQQPFLEMLSVPTVGSMNLVRHIASAEEKAQAKKKSNKEGEKPVFQSINAKDLLKQHKAEMAEIINNRKQQQQQKTSQQKTSKQGSHSKEGSHSKKRRLSGQTSAADQNAVNPATTSVAEVKRDTPMLGKGFYPGGKIDLFAESSAGSRLKPSSTEMAKRKAIEKVQAIGGLEKSDPNAVRHPIHNPEKIKKRILENIENEHKKSHVSVGGGEGSSTEPHGSAEPPRKRSRLLGNVDPNSSEVKQLLNARSSHTGALAEAEAEREERYFDNLEKKEMMEEKMKTITTMEVSVVSCEQCKYTAMSQSERCKQEGHSVRRHKGKRRFFACKKCKHRTVSLHRYPTEPCRKCGEQCYEKTTMYKEKTGPKTESEILSLRGDESKFTSAMDQKVYMSCMVQDCATL